MIDRPSLDREITVRAAEHEHILSFVNDQDAYLFEIWWNDQGIASFMHWAEKHEDTA